MPPSSFVKLCAREGNNNYACLFLSVCLVFLLIIGTRNPGVQSFLRFQVDFRNRYLPGLRRRSWRRPRPTSSRLPPSTSLPSPKRPTRCCGRKHAKCSFVWRSDVSISKVSSVCASLPTRMKSAAGRALAEEQAAAEPGVDNEIHPQKNGFSIMFALLISFIAADAYLNSKNEYEAMALDGKSSIDELSQLQMILFGSTIVLQLSIASSFFLILCNTFPFQVGLLFPFQKGICKMFLVFQTVYMFLSCTVGGMRLVRTQVFPKTSS